MAQASDVLITPYTCAFCLNIWKEITPNDGRQIHDGKITSQFKADMMVVEDIYPTGTIGAMHRKNMRYVFDKFEKAIKKDTLYLFRYDEEISDAKQPTSVVRTYGYSILYKPVNWRTWRNLTLNLIKEHFQRSENDTETTT